MSYQNERSSYVRIWLDRLLCADHALSYLEQLIKFHCQLIIDGMAIDVKQFQSHATWLEENLKNNNIIIEVWNSPDEVIKEGFYWNSYSHTTGPAKTLEESVRELPNADRILEISRLIKEYGIPREVWNTNSAPHPTLSQSVCSVLGLHTFNTSPEKFFGIATKHMRIDLYSLGYAQRVAKFHHCDAVMEIGNSLTMLF